VAPAATISASAGDIFRLPILQQSALHDVWQYSDMVARARVSIVSMSFMV